MSTATTWQPPAPRQLPAGEPLPPRPSISRRYLRESALLIGRGLRTAIRVPERLSDVTLQPIVFTLLFLYVFGSAIHIPGMRYQDYLLPGMIAQSIAFGVIGSGVASATDFTSGVTDRFKSLPVTRLAVITAQIAGQMIEQALGMLIIAALGLSLGWRPHLNAATLLEVIGLVLLGLLAFTTFGVLLGMTLRSADAIQGIGFAVVFPMAFLGGTFVPIAGMRLVPRTIADYNPLSAIVAAIRQVTQGTNSGGSWPLQHPVIAAVAYCALITAICLPLAVRKFSRPA
jgi:ABC-2 type transport system permease protein